MNQVHSSRRVDTWKNSIPYSGKIWRKLSLAISAKMPYFKGGPTWQLYYYAGM